MHAHLTSNFAETRYLVCTEWLGPNYQLFSLIGLIFAVSWQVQTSFSPSLILYDTAMLKLFTRRLSPLLLRLAT